MRPVVITHPAAATRLLVVMGVSGSGKTSLAKALAEHYGYEFWDADDFHSHEARALMASGQPLTDEMRIPWVRGLQAHLREEAKRHRHCTLAFSGLKYAHRNIIRDAGLKTLFLFLRGDKATIQERLLMRTNHFMPPGLLDSQIASLEDPSGEKDVLPIDVTFPLAKVVAHAVSAVGSVKGWHDEYLSGVRA